MADAYELVNPCAKEDKGCGKEKDKNAGIGGCAKEKDKNAGIGGCAKEKDAGIGGCAKEKDAGIGGCAKEKDAGIGGCAKEKDKNAGIGGCAKEKDAGIGGCAKEKNAGIGGCAKEKNAGIGGRAKEKDKNAGIGGCAKEKDAGIGGCAKEKKDNVYYKLEDVQQVTENDAVENKQATVITSRELLSIGLKDAAQRLKDASEDVTTYYEKLCAVDSLPSVKEKLHLANCTNAALNSLDITIQPRLLVKGKQISDLVLVNNSSEDKYVRLCGSVDYAKMPALVGREQFRLGKKSFEQALKLEIYNYGKFIIPIFEDSDIIGFRTSSNELLIRVRATGFGLTGTPSTEFKFKNHWIPEGTVIPLPPSELLKFEFSTGVKPACVFGFIKALDDSDRIKIALVKRKQFGRLEE